MRVLLRCLAVLPVAVAAASPSDAATLRVATVLTAPVVHLSDLFDDAGPNAARVLGPGPAPGGRITVEAPQLEAIARQFGVAWKPISGGEMAVLERPGKPMPEAVAITALRAALTEAGAPASADVVIAAYAAPVLPADAVPSVTVAGLDYDRGSGRFAATLSVSCTDGSTTSLRVVGSAVDMVSLPVLLHRTPPGAVLRAEDVTLARVRSDSVRVPSAQVAADAVGRELRRMVFANQPIAMADLTAPVLVHKQDNVAMTLDSPGISVSARGRALDEGGAGDMIRVRNPASGAVVEATITGPDQVRVAPGSTPLPDPRHEVAFR